jgi:hypothetical protein
MKAPVKIDTWISVGRKMRNTESTAGASASRTDTRITAEIPNARPRALRTSANTSAAPNATSVSTVADAGGVPGRTLKTHSVTRTLTPIRNRWSYFPPVK